MARGGPRDGSGRKPGSRNSKTVEQVAAIEASGVTPLEYLLSIMRDADAEPAARIDCAKAAAPYVHARLSNIEGNVKTDNKHVISWEG